MNLREWFCWHSWDKWVSVSRPWFCSVFSYPYVRQCRKCEKLQVHLVSSFPYQPYLVTHEWDEVTNTLKPLSFRGVRPNARNIT